MRLRTSRDGRSRHPSRIAFERASGTFSRTVHVEASDDGKNWSSTADDTLERFADGSSHLAFAFPETTARYLRVVVHNGNDASLAGLVPVVFVRPREIVFAASDAHRYWLLSSNPAASRPIYDLADRLTHARWNAAVALVGATLPNPGYHAPPLTIGERYPWLLSSVVAVVAVLLAVFRYARFGMPARRLCHGRDQAEPQRGCDRARSRRHAEL